MSSGEVPSAVGGAVAACVSGSMRADALRQLAREKVLRAETLRSEADALQDAAEGIYDEADKADRDALLEDARKIQSALKVLRDLVGSLGVRMGGVLSSLDVLQEASGPQYRRRLCGMPKAELVARVLELSALMRFYGADESSPTLVDDW